MAPACLTNCQPFSGLFLFCLLPCYVMNVVITNLHIDDVYISDHFSYCILLRRLPYYLITECCMSYTTYHSFHCCYFLLIFCPSSIVPGLLWYRWVIIPLPAILPYCTKLSCPLKSRHSLLKPDPWLNSHTCNFSHNCGKLWRKWKTDKLQISYQ